MTSSERIAAMRVRRQPPPFRHARVQQVARLSPRMVALTLAGPELGGFNVEHPGASVRLLLPPPEAADVVPVPIWNGNEFLLPDGRRPTIRTLTPRRVRPEPGELDLEIVLHGRGAASEWAAAVVPGAPAAISGPGRGYAVDLDAPAFLLGGDETAIPAICQLLEVLPAGTPVSAYIEVVDPEARLPLPDRPGTHATWCDLPEGSEPGSALVTAIAAADLPTGTRVWIAGEAAAVQRIRRYLFDERGLPRSQATVRGYWKHGRAGDTDADD